MVPSARPTDLQEQDVEDSSTLVLLDQLALVQFLMGNLGPAEKTLQQLLRSGPVAASPQLSAVAQLRLGTVLLGVPQLLGIRCTCADHGLLTGRLATLCTFRQEADPSRLPASA